MGSSGPVSAQVVVTNIAECTLEIDVLITGNNSLDHRDVPNREIPQLE